MSRKGLEYSDLEPIEANVDCSPEDLYAEQEYLRKELLAPHRPSKGDDYMQARNDAHHAFSMRPFDGLGGSGLAGAYDRRKIMLRSAVGNKAMSQCSQRAGHGDQANAPPTIDPLSDLLAQLSQFGPGDLRGGCRDPSQSSGLPQSSSLLYAGGQGSSSRAALQQQLRSDTGMASTFGWLTDAGASTRTSPRRPPRSTMTEPEARQQQESQAVRALFMQDVLFSTLSL